MTQPQPRSDAETPMSNDESVVAAEGAAVTEFRMPSLLPGVTSGEIAKWHVREGQEIAPGDVIADIRTDKATIEVEADEAGQIQKILHPAGPASIVVGAAIAVILVRPAGQSNPDLAEAENVDGLDGTKGEAPSALASVGRPDDGGVAGGGEPEPVASQRRQKSAKPFDGEVHSAKTYSRSAPENETPIKNITLRVALREALAEEMERDERVLIIGEDVASEDSTYKVTHGLRARFGERRVRDMPVTEAGFTGLAVGAAMAGLRPVVEFQHWSFALQAIDQIINTAAKMRYVSGGHLNVPIVLRGANGAGSRTGAQQAQNFAAWYASVPGLVVVTPASPADAKGLLKQAIRSADPVLMLETERLYGRVGPVPDVSDHLCPFGSAAVIREGGSVSLVSYSGGVALCLEAAKRLASEGIDAEVIDLRSLRPLDEETVFASVRKTHRLVTVEEAWPTCGIGSELAARVMTACFDELDAPVTRVTGADVPMPYAANLERLALPSAGDVVAAAKKVCYQ